MFWWQIKFEIQVFKCNKSKSDNLYIFPLFTHLFLDFLFCLLTLSFCFMYFLIGSKCDFIFHFCTIPMEGKIIGYFFGWFASNGHYKTNLLIITTILFLCAIINISFLFFVRFNCWSFFHAKLFLIWFYVFRIGLVFRIRLCYILVCL